MVQTPIGRKGLDFRLVLEVEGVDHRHPRLLHRRGRQGVAADHVAGRIDVRDAGLEMLVDQDLALFVELHADLLELEWGDVAAPAQRHEEGFGLEAPPRAEPQRQRKAGLDPLDGVRRSKLDAERLHRLGQHVADFLVGERQQPLAGVDDAHLVQAQHLEEAGVFAADGAASHDRQRAGEPLHAQDRVRVVHARLAEGKHGGPVGGRAGGDQDDAGLEQPRPLLRVHPDRVDVDEGRPAVKDVDVVAVEVGADPLIERLADRAAAMHEPVDGQGAIVGEGEPVEVALPEPGQVQGRLAHGLARDPGVRHRPAVARRLLDERDLLAEVRRLGGALLPGA
jgi:hypothetical protein